LLKIKIFKSVGKKDILYNSKFLKPIRNPRVLKRKFKDESIKEVEGK